MTNLTSPSAQWYEMTNEEKIEWLATNIMGWEKTQSYWCSHLPESKYTIQYRHGLRGSDEFSVWNPLKDWNHWRQVEEKIMEDKDLAYKYWVQIRGEIFDKGIDPIELIWRTDLPTRAKALFLALL